ncbi:MAG: hypothetical protein K5945_07870, partial [Bacteroidaceae bacterium]|nr:hypothetical protein [Bacteroidaceae bacterium]
IALSAWFFIKGNSIKGMMSVKLHDFDEAFKNKYVCPNPSCGRSFGTMRYRDLKYMKSCPACGCRYTAE